jgi:manganese/iron transport system permease protein/iron/zinc/copper transport system permease protein
MTWFAEAFLEPWTHAYFLKGVVGGSVIAVACAVLGCYVILRKMAFIGDAMSHALLPGVGIGYLVMNAIFPEGFSAGGLLLGALIAAILTSLCISFLSGIGRIAEDTAIGIIYTGLFAAGVVILTRFQQYIHIDLNHFFQGDIYGVSWSDMWLGAVVAAAVLGIIVIFYRHFTIVSFDPTMAASIGLPTKFIHVLLTGMIAMVCVAGISMVGVIMIVGLLITPAALAYMLTDRLPRMMVLASVFGILSVVSGLYFSEWVNASGGGSIMFVGFLLFVVGLFLAPKYGLLASWRRRATLVPQSDVEDILKAALGGQHAGNDIPLPRKRVQRAIRRMVRDGLLEAGPAASNTLALTPAGDAEARHIRRSHQLWEGHFIKTGMDAEKAHAAAERLEHLHGRDIMDQFDDELGHPLTDVHGTEVPGEVPTTDDDDQLPITLALLRPGDRGQLPGSAVPGALPHGLVAGDIVELVDRDPGRERWVIRTSDGRELILGHAEADALVLMPST